jgi:putative FmdB family regulatory protein
MPVYEYHCTSCGKDFEYEHRMSDPRKTVCEACGGELERLISRTSFAFKGGGWYKDLYASPKAPSGGGDSGGGAPSGGTSGGGEGGGGGSSGGTSGGGDSGGSSSGGGTSGGGGTSSGGGGTSSGGGGTSTAAAS